MVDQSEGQGDEEVASLDMWGVCAGFHRGFLTILDMVLTVGESAGASLTLTQEAS
jgi:hypothetical protein